MRNTKSDNKVGQKLSNGCRPWLGAYSRIGYGDRKLLRHGKLWRGAHRCAYVLAYGPVPDGMEVGHTCHNRWCVEPSHLVAITHAENQQMRPGRTVCANGHKREPKRSCKECAKAAQRRFRERHPERVRVFLANYRAKRASGAQIY